jgi:endonuclease YncB( thermonuclease family)
MTYGGRRALRNAFVILLLAAGLMLALRQPSPWQESPGSYTAVDGDSLRRGETDYRLYGIDAPELQQSCGNRMGGEYQCGREARRALARLVAGRELSCQELDEDRYGRKVVRCRDEGRDIGRAMVREGWAIAYLRHSADYVADETAARAAKRGLWAGSFEEPEDWRNLRRNFLSGAAAAD